MTATPFAADYSAEFGQGGSPTGDTAWPTVDDVKNYLRLGTGVTPDDSLVADQLNAAIGWVSVRVDAKFLPDSGGLLPYPVFTATVMEAGRLYRRRDSVDGTVGWGDMGVVRVGPKDPDIETMLASFLAIVLA
jgi:hypothetical protein